MRSSDKKGRDAIIYTRLGGDYIIRCMEIVRFSQLYLLAVFKQAEEIFCERLHLRVILDCNLSVSNFIKIRSTILSLLSNKRSSLGSKVCIYTLSKIHSLWHFYLNKKIGSVKKITVFWPLLPTI